MVARVKPAAQLLVVTFVRDGEEAESQYAAEGQHAAAVAISMIASRLRLQPGDTLTVRSATDKEPPLPETSRASHYS